MKNTNKGERAREVPFFNKAKVGVEFTGIAVNKELHMVNGFLNVTGTGVEVVPSEMMDLMDDLSETLNQIGSVLDDIEANLPQPFDPNSFVADTLISIPGEISSVYNDNGTIVIVDQHGNETRLPVGEDYAIKDDAGNGWLVDSKGGVHKTTAENATKAGNREYNLKVQFDADPLARYGFDERNYDALAQHYEQLEGNYNVAWKVVASGVTDPVTATLEDNSIDKSKVRFELFSFPVPAPPMTNDQSTTVTLTGKSDGTIEDLLALYNPADTTKKEQVLGKLKVITYDKITRNLVIVPVNGNAYPGDDITLLNQELNKIFGQSVVEWSVSLAQGITVSLDETFDDGESGLLTNYTDDMKKVIREYKDEMDENNEDTYYLFLVSKPKSGSTLGYMPRSKQAGFIFVDVHGNDPTKLTHTIAHELAHGAFNLRHTFSEFPTIEEGTTDNLLDYTTNGTHLFKYQWDNIHHPQIVIGLFEEDEEGALFASKDRDSISVKILKINSDFIPGFGQLEVSYSLGAKTMSMIERYPKEKFQLFVSIANKNGSFVHVAEDTIQLTGTFEWSGYLNGTKADSITLQDGPYKLAIILIGGEEKGWFDSWTSFKDKLYLSLNADSVEQITASTDTTFALNALRIEWLQNEKLQKYINNDFKYYEKLHSMYMDYEGVKKEGNPFEYIKSTPRSLNSLERELSYMKSLRIFCQKLKKL